MREHDQGRLAVQFHDACVVGANHGEWGGAIEIDDRGSLVGSRKNWYTNPQALLRVGDRVLVVESLHHLMSSHGRLTEVTSQDGRWHIEPVAELPAGVLGLAMQNQEVLVASDWHAPDCPDAPTLFAVGDDGKLRLVSAPRD